MMKDLNIKADTINHLEENGVDDAFFGYDHDKHKQQKQKSTNRTISN